ncbi:MAG: hypothetical protein AABY22_20875 [Nanoarchaeota archaeon]
MLIKQVFGSFWAISGLTKEIYNLHLSLFNWGAINNPNLLEIGNDFKYFLVRYDDYLKFRTMAFASNWQNYWIKTKNGKMISNGISILDILLCNSCWNCNISSEAPTDFC